MQRNRAPTTNVSSKITVVADQKATRFNPIRVPVRYGDILHIMRGYPLLHSTG